MGAAGQAGGRGSSGKGAGSGSGRSGRAGAGAGAGVGGRGGKKSDRDDTYSTDHLLDDQDWVDDEGAAPQVID
jgi:hypothetical protein